MVKTAVVILNYNGKHYLEQFLPGIVQHCEEDCKVFIADNASTDGSIPYLKARFPSVSLILLPQNLGFSHGYNKALKQIEAQYYILLNSDVEVTPQWAAPLIQMLDDNPGIAACQPKILSYHNKTCFEYAGAAGGFIDYLGYPFCRGRIFDTLEQDNGQYNDAVPIFWATGACFAIRSQVFHSLKGFDETFFAHMEEIDLCWRIHLKGQQVYYCGNSQVFHVGGGTLSKTNPHKTYLNFRNGLAMLYKNTYGNHLYWRLFLRISLDMVAAIKFLFSNSFQDFIAVFRAIKDFFRRYHSYKEKKLAQIPLKHLEIKEIYQYSIVRKYFLKKIKYFWELKF